MVEGLAGGPGAPLGGGVGDVHDPEEAFAHVSPAEGDGVDLKHAGLTGLVKSAWPCGDFGGEGCFVAGTFVRLVGHQAVRSDDARDGGDAHAAQFVSDGLRDRRFRLRVIPDGCIHDSVEVEWAHLSHRQPDTDEGPSGLRGIGWGPSVMGVVTIGAIEQTDDKLPRQLAHPDCLIDQLRLIRSCSSLGVSSSHSVHVFSLKRLFHGDSLGAIVFDT